MSRPSIPYEEKLYRCEVLSRTVLEKGNLGKRRKNISEEDIYKYWDKEEVLPSFDTITIGNIKWYLKEKIKWEHPIWSGSFIQGLTKVGVVQYKKQTFPSFSWNACPHIWDMINASPFGGKQYPAESNMEPHHWKSVPALYLKGNEDSIEYVAGLMAGLQRIENKKGITYARISSRLLPHIKALGIPIDHKTRSDVGNGISPIWPMLFKDYMPPENKQWENIKKPLNGELYAKILWKTYVSNTFISDGIPFLPSRRTIFYRHKKHLQENGDEYWMGRKVGALKRIEKMRFDNKLFNLNQQVIQAVKNYGQKSLENYK